MLGVFSRNIFISNDRQVKPDIAVQYDNFPKERKQYLQSP